MKPLIVFDEAGNTGQDLTNIDQPVFVQSSVMVNDNVASKILSILATKGSPEGHYSSLKRSKTGRNKILAMFESGLLTPDNAKLSYIHKRFMIITKVVDLLIEPIMHDDGVDLYERGGNIALSNLHYYCMPVLCGEECTSTFYKLFVDMIRFKTRESFFSLYDHIKYMIIICKYDNYKHNLIILYMTCKNIDYVLGTANIVSLDPAVPSFVMHCAEWGRKLKRKFDLIHDDSKPIANQSVMLSMLMAEDEKEVTVGYDRRKFELPLKATGIQFADSKTVKQIQIADVLAGVGASWVQGCIEPNRKSDIYWKSLNDISVDKYIFNAVWPTPNVTPKDLGTDEVGGISGADYIADMLIRQKIKTS